MLLLGLALAVLIGLSLGILGGGGSILTVPIFVYVLRYGVRESIAMSLVVVGLTSAVGAVGHWRAGNTNLRAAVVFTPVAMIGTFFGARLALHVGESLQLALFAIIMLAAAVFMFTGARSIAARMAGEGERGKGAATVALVGAGVGVLTGLLGVGGGFLIVPALVLLAALPMKQAVGTSLIVIALNCASGVAGYLGRVPMDWMLLGEFSLVAFVGVALGTWMVRYISQDQLRRGFAVFLIVMGIFVLVKGRVKPERHAGPAPAAETGE